MRRRILLYRRKIIRLKSAPLEKQEEIDNYTAQIKTYDVVLHVKPEKASQIHAQVINGEKCLVIPMRENENATINGVNTSL